MRNLYVAYAGTYTNQTSEGIYRFELDANAGRLQSAELAAKVDHPTYLTTSAGNDYLYSVAEAGKSGGINVYAIEAGNGRLTQTDSKLQEGVPPCHVSVQGDMLVTANYHEGSVGLYEMKNSRINNGIFSFHSGRGPHERQEGPHIHYAGFSLDKKFVFVVDLGIDEIVTYQIEALKQENRPGASAHASLSLRAGSGPRHLVFHPNNRTAYIITELSSEVVVLDYNPDTGVFQEKQYLKTIPQDYTGENYPSAIRISRDGRFVYTSNRGHDSISVFQVNDEAGTLELVDITPSGGAWPRDFVLDPSEAYLVAANQHTNNIVLFSRNQATGRLTRLDTDISVPEAVCVHFLT